MDLDQSQEHSVKHLKDGGSIKGLKIGENEVIEISRPDIQRCIEEFEDSIHTTNGDSTRHPDSTAVRQKAFMKDINAMLQLVSDGKIAYPMDTEEKELVSLDIREIMDLAIADSLGNIDDTGKSLRNNAMSERVEHCSLTLSNPFNKHNLNTFTNRLPSDLRKGDARFRFSTAKANLSMVTKMFINLRAKPDADMKDFFRYEISRDPPSLSNKGKLYSGCKSDLIPILPGMPDPGIDSKNKVSNSSYV